MAKYYYIDKDGNKKKYAGEVIINNDGTYSGVFTISKLIKDKVELTKHEKVDTVYGYSSYYTYLNSDNKTVKYYNIPKFDRNNEPYFTYTAYENINLIYYPPVEHKDEYFTYTTKEGEFIYTGKVTYNKKNNSYTGKLS